MVILVVMMLSTSLCMNLKALCHVQLQRLSDVALEHQGPISASFCLLHVELLMLVI